MLNFDEGAVCRQTDFRLSLILLAESHCWIVNCPIKYLTGLWSSQLIQWRMGAIVNTMLWHFPSILFLSPNTPRKPMRDSITRDKTALDCSSQTNHNCQDRYPVVKIHSIPNCKMQNKKTQGIPPQTGSHTGISLGYRALPWGLMSKCPRRKHVIKISSPIPTWKVQNKNLQGIPPQKRSHMGISLGVRASFQNIQLEQPQPPRSDILSLKFPQFKFEKLKMKISQGITPDGSRHRHITWIGLALGLDLHYEDSPIVCPSTSTRTLFVSCPSTSTTQDI
jgi:hypothetical protein